MDTTGEDVELLVPRVWAKAGKGTVPHPLLCHMIDTAMVALLLLERVLAPELAARLGAGLADGVRGRVVAWLCGLHDLGKCSAWQLKRPDLVTDAGLSSVRERWEQRWREVPHGLVTAVHLRRALPGYGVDGTLGHLAADAVGGHHGVFFTAEQRRPFRPEKTDALQELLGGPEWKRLRDIHMERLAQVLGVPLAGGLLAGWRIAPTDGVLLAGLTAAADWIASNEKWFRYAGVDVDLEEYPAVSRNRAEKALAALGWTRWAPGARDLAGLVPEGNELRCTQRAVAEVDREVLFREPGIVVVEDAMGGGKTEIAEYLAAGWAHALGRTGFYFALPTQATSNQMLGRIREFLRRTGGGVLLHLLHGTAGLNDEFAELLREGRADDPLAAVRLCDDDAADGDAGEVSARVWFTWR